MFGQACNTRSFKARSEVCRRNGLQRPFQTMAAADHSLHISRRGVRNRWAHDSVERSPP